MSSNRGRGKRHHHPVNSLCRKLQTIKMMDQASNPALQIPKFQSKNFDSPQGNMKKNLEEIWKRRTLKTRDDSTVPSSDSHSLSPFSDKVYSPCSPVETPSHRRISDIRSETLSVGRNKEKTCRPWIDQAEGCSPCLLDWGELGSNPPYGSTGMEQKGTSSQEWTYLTSSPDLLSQEHRPVKRALQAPVNRRLSLGRRLLTEANDDEGDEVSLICEEDLLTTMFSACDVERRGKVAVSKLVDFLRFTTSRSSEDSKLEELCNMLDPEQRDISMDLETYHAIMKEWIEDCRRNWHEPSTWETTREGTQAAKRTPGRMNVTSGSLEALGGDVSRGDLETSDLIACIADLQFNNQKLQEENGQLKVALDTMEEANNRLTEEGGELRNQIKSFQQSVAQVKTLQRELEESKNNLSAAEEKGLKMASQTKQLEKENQSLIFKISSLQEENIRTALDADGFQKKIAELSRNMAELQMQVHLYENMVGNKDTSLLKKDMDVQELKSTLKEYTSVIETLRAEKNKLVKDVQRMQQELISNGINFPLMHKLNSSNLEATNSLHCELELAEEQLEVGNDLKKFPSTEWSLLDESVDREVLQLLQELERVGERFKTAIQNLQGLFHLDELPGLSLLQGSDAETNGQEAYEKRLGALRQDLEARRTLWLQKLELLEAQKESLDKGLVKMAVQLRKMRTEQLHLKRVLSSRQCELASATKLQEDAEGEAAILRSALQEARNQLEEALKRVEDQEGHFRASCEEAHSLQKELGDSIATQERLQGINLCLTQTCQLLEQKVQEQSDDLGSLRKKSFIGPLGRTLYQESSYNQRFEVPQRWPFGSSWSPVLRCCFSQDSSLLDALALDSLLLVRRSSAFGILKNTGPSSAFEEPHLSNGSILDVMLEEDRCKSGSAGNQTDAAFPSGTRMDADFAKGDVQPLTDVLPSSDSIPSQEVSSLAPECTKGSNEKDSTLPHTMEDHARQADSLPVEETAATARQAEMEAPRSAAAGDCSTEGLSSVAVCRNRQKGSVSPSEKEVEAEFLRLSLGFKCDLFTLEKRVRLEERSRDLAEGNLRKEIASSLKLLDSLASLSEDNQVQEIAKKLQKSLELLNQHATRIASKAEMLGAIHQGQLNETDGSQRNDKFSRRPSWALLGAKQGEKPPLLQRYVSYSSWTESEEDQAEAENSSLDLPPPDQGSKTQKPSEKESSPSKWRLLSLCTRAFSWTSHARRSFCRASKALYVSVGVVALLAVLLAFLLGVPFQRSAEAAPLGTGDAWTSVQQLLWPYTGLHHQGPPPV